MKRLADFIREEIFSTPMNTLGVGDVQPMTGCDGLAFKKKRKNKKQRLKKKS